MRQHDAFRCRRRWARVIGRRKQAGLGTQICVEGQLSRPPRARFHRYVSVGVYDQAYVAPRIWTQLADYSPPPPSGVSSRNGPPIELVAATRTPFKGRVANEKATYHLGCQPASPGQDGRNSPMKYQLLRRIMVGF